MKAVDPLLVEILRAIQYPPIVRCKECGSYECGPFRCRFEDPYAQSTERPDDHRPPLR